MHRTHYAHTNNIIIVCHKFKNMLHAYHSHAHACYRIVHRLRACCSRTFVAYERVRAYMCLRVCMCMHARARTRVSARRCVQQCTHRVTPRYKPPLFYRFRLSQSQRRAPQPISGRRFASALSVFESISF